MPIKRRSHFAPSSLSQGELEQLGRLIAWWGYLEYQAMVIVRVCTGTMTKEDMWLILIGAEVKALSGFLRTIAFSDHWVSAKAFRDEIEQFASAFQDAVEDRNAHVHAVYGYVDNNPAKRVRHSFKPKGHRATPGFAWIDEAKLKTLADNAETLWLRAQDLTDRLKPYMKQQRAQRKALKGKLLSQRRGP